MVSTTAPPKTPRVTETRPGDYIAVDIGGLIVWHSHEQWELFCRGVDMESSRVLGKPS